MLSNSIKTHTLDPTVHNSSRTEFRLPSGVLASSIQLTNAGVWSSSVGGDNGLYYPSRMGVLASMKSIALYSGGQLLDEIQELPTWASIQHCLASNQQCEDLDRFDLMNGNSLSLDKDGAYTFTAPDKDFAHRNTAIVPRGTNALNQNKELQLRFHNQQQIASAEFENGGRSGSINLKQVLGLLGSMDTLPNLPDLRLLITWNLAGSNYVEDANAPDGTGGIATATVSVPGTTYLANAQVNVGGQIKAISGFLTAGTGYTTANGLATTSDGQGTGCTVDIVAAGGAITTITLNAVGRDYQEDEVLTITQGGAANGTFRVTDCNRNAVITLSNIGGGGAIAGVTIDSAGQNYAVGDILVIPGGDGAGRLTVNSVNSVPSSYNNIRPTLVVDELLDVAPPESAQLPYLSVFVERFPVPAVNAGVESSKSFRSGAFRQRMLRDLILVNRPKADKFYLKRNEISTALVNEEIQLVINGSNWLPEQGVDSPAAKMRLFQDTFGSLQSTLSCYLPSVVDEDNAILAKDAENFMASRENTGTLSLFGCKIGQMIERLDIEHKFLGSNNATQSAELQNNGFDLIAFGRCARMLEMQGGKLRISY